MCVVLLATHSQSHIGLYTWECKQAFIFIFLLYCVRCNTVNEAINGMKVAFGDVCGLLTTTDTVIDQLRRSPDIAALSAMNRFFVVVDMW